MEHLNVFTLLWIFFMYSFAGWCLETIVATIRNRNFVNRGLVSGPLCIIYGIGTVVISIGLRGLTGFWLFFFSAVIATVVEWIGGHLIEHIFQERWWDYSERKWNLDGYICLGSTTLWGVLGYLAVRFGNPLLMGLVHIFPKSLGKIVVLVLFVLLILDIAASYHLLYKRSTCQKQWEETNHRFLAISRRLEHYIGKKVEGRIHKAYKVTPAKEKETTFAARNSFYKIVLLFFIGAFLGDITETIFCRITAGVWMSRSSVVWGPFSIVWGLAIALVTALLYRYKDKSDRFLFLCGTVLGGVYEYLCSVFTELIFGKVFWDYSKIPFNLGGRINLLYCFFWGIAAVVWFKHIFPFFEKWIEKIPKHFGKIATWCLILFMIANIMVSSLAMIRQQERSNGVLADTSWQEWMDLHYDDETLQRIYPNAITVE